MAVHLITGFKGEEHIQSADQGSFNASFFGEGEFVMEAGNQCEASILDNNTVRVLDGDILMHGRHIRIPSNTYIDVTIQTGTAGVNRNDLIVMEYSKDAGTGIETADLKVIKGVAAEGTASDPAFTSGDILAGDSLSQMPLYRVKVEGVVLSAVEPMFTTIPTYKKLAEQYAEEFQEACETHLNSLNILDSKEEIEANTQENQLAGALGVKELIASLYTEEEICQIVGMKYNPATDEKFLMGQDGEWHFDCYGGLLKNWIYDNGKVYKTLYTNVGGLGTSGTTTLEVDHILVTANGTSASGRRQGVRTEEEFNLTDAEVIYLDYEVISGTQNVYIVIQSTITDSSDFTGNSEATSVLTGLTTGASGTLELNVSNLSGKYYLYFGVVAQASDSKTKLYKMYCK